MIVPMLKLSLLVFNEDYRDFLEDLRKKGVVHINVNKDRSAEDTFLQEKLALAKRIDGISRAMDSIVAEKDAHSTLPYNEDLSGLDLLEDTEKRLARCDQIESEKAVLLKEQSMYAPWGNTLPYSDLEKLRAQGWNVRFYSLPDKYYDENWEQEFNAVVIANDKGNTYFVTVIPEDGGRNCPMSSICSRKSPLMNWNPASVA